jgi:predicted CXXCH cytochrome family protein
MKKLDRLLFLPVLLIPSMVISQSIVNTKHNLSVTGPGNVKDLNETEICIFCHTPHENHPYSPVWNHNDPGSTYTLYSSSTLQALPGQPDGPSILCLSCHDGTIAMGNSVINQASFLSVPGPASNSAASNLTTNLMNDHPISFIYNSALTSIDGQLKSSSNISPSVSLRNGKVQCTSCHDPHKNIYSDFLVATTQNSELCNSCHERTFWTTSSHNNSSNTWNSTGSNPWPYTPWTTVAQNGCENCHNPHNSGGDELLLKYQAEENNCIDCHNGNVATKNVWSQFSKAYRHNVTDYLNIHDASEQALVTSMHVECVDCHNPHASNNLVSAAPNISGALKGVKGINQSGSPVGSATFSYEVCYRCHAGSPGAPVSSTLRVLIQNNVRLEFSPGNPSYHPVASAGVNNNVPSLIAPWAPMSRMSCTDCHSSDGQGSPAGPHGSIYPHILKQQYSTANKTIESYSSYALCYSCHNRSSILSDVSFKEHKKHIVDEMTPCNACHDPHGISGAQGNSINNSNLINFWTTVVNSSSSGILRFEDQGNFRGRCYLTCHGKDHNPLSY